MRPEPSRHSLASAAMVTWAPCCSGSRMTQQGVLPLHACTLACSSTADPAPLQHCLPMSTFPGPCIPRACRPAGWRASDAAPQEHAASVAHYLCGTDCWQWLQELVADAQQPEQRRAGLEQGCRTRTSRVGRQHAPAGSPGRHHCSAGGSGKQFPASGQHKALDIQCTCRSCINDPLLPLATYQI